MPNINPSPNVRFALYILGAVGTAVVGYLAATGRIGEAEVGLWAALAVLLNGLSAANVNKPARKLDNLED